jgi:prepilin-type N-terminal cleavage/methylation domain-containing protein
MRKKAFTLIELLVVIAIIALLVSILLPSLTRARELAKQTICGTRLSGLGKAFTLYANENRDNYPALEDPDNGFSATIDNDPQSRTKSNFYDNEWGCNIQPLWLMVHDGFVGEDQFACPSDGEHQELEVDTDHNWGFDKWTNVSYAFQPFTPVVDSGGNDAVTNAAPPNTAGQDSAFVLVGDKLDVVNSDPSNNNTEWTDNHPGYGGNFLAMNHSVAFKKDEHNLVGWNQNCVFLTDIDSDGDFIGNHAGSLQGSIASEHLPDYKDDSSLFWTRGSNSD